MGTSGSEGGQQKPARSNAGPGAAGRPYTYLRTRAGWVYLCGIKDACSRKVISTAMSTTMTTDLVEEALRRARTLRPNAPGRVVIHSDRGAQFTSEQMYQCCQELKLDQSMGRTGVAGAPPAWSAARGGMGQCDDRIPMVRAQK